MFGGFICVATLMISISIIAYAKRRHILAFEAQQVMPVAQEGIEKISPTIANAAGSIAKSISQGIAKGKKMYDKRETIKQRDINKDIQKRLKGN